MKNYSSNTSNYITMVLLPDTMVTMIIEEINFSFNRRHAKNIYMIQCVI